MKFLLATAIFLSIILSGCGEKTEEETKQNITLVESQTQDPSTIKLTDISGKEFQLKIKEKGFDFVDFQGKVVMLNFFTTWCPPCKAEIPHLNNLQNRYKDQLQIISILLEENKDNEEIIRFTNAHNVEFTIANSKENFRLAKHIGGVQSIPYMIIYDKNGDYFKHYIGAIPEEMIEADLKKVF